jgi:DNA-binding transcriptional MerR regulator
MDLIDRLRRTGMSVRQMREYTAWVKVGPTTLRRRQQLLRAHRRRLEEMADYLAGSLELIDFKLNFYETWLATGVEPKAAAPCQMVRRDGSPITMPLPQQRLKGR